MKLLFSGTCFLPGSFIAIFFFFRSIALQKLNVVNGVVFTGGWCMEGPYYQVIQMIFQVIDVHCSFVFFSYSNLSPIFRVFRRLSYANQHLGLKLVLEVSVSQYISAITFYW